MINFKETEKEIFDICTSIAKDDGSAIEKIEEILMPKDENKKDIQNGDKYNYKVLIDSKEFQRKILDHIVSEEFDKQFNNTIFSTYEDNKKYKQAMMHGMVMASIMISQCESLCVKEKVEIENNTDIKTSNNCEGCCHDGCCGYFSNLNKFDISNPEEEQKAFEEFCVGCCCGDGAECNRDQGCDNYEPDPIMS